MKKIFLFLLFILAGAGTIFAQNGTCGGNLTWNLNNGILTISGTGDMANWNPEWSISSIAPWFSYKDNITSVIIGNGVTSIGSYAFYNCSGLTSIEIPNSVTSIRAGACQGCSALTSVTILNSVTEIGGSAFEGCSGLTSVTIPNSVTSMGVCAFLACSNLTTVTLNSNAIVNGYSKCYKCTIVHYFGSQVKKYILGNSVTSIGDFAFSYCSDLTSITIPTSVTSIGDAAFSYCSGLTSITIPTSVTSIGDAAFSYCSGLTSITIPNSVTSIGNNAFINCSGLTSITIPNSVTRIGDYAFAGCTALTSVTIPNSVTSMGEGAFYSCSSLPVIDNIRYADTYLVEAVNKTLSIYTIKEGTRWIGREAFSDCSALSNITIPNTVLSIEGYAFVTCDCLLRITIPNSVTRIGDEAFICDKLAHVGFVSKIPPTLGANVFINYRLKPWLYVPCGSSSTYCEAWPEYTSRIVESACGFFITFVNWDNTELQSSFVQQGKMPVYTGNTPTRPDDEHYTYVFKGWTPEIVPSEADATYTAVYNATAKSEGFEVVMNGGTATKILRNGQILILRGDKTYNLQGQLVNQ